MIILLDWQQRLVKESTALSDKRQKLNVFLLSGAGDAMRETDREMWALLVEQNLGMKIYNEALQARLTLLGIMQ